MGKQAPAPQDFQGAANTQAQSSQNNVNAQTAANRLNSNGAFTNTSFTTGPDGQQTVNQSLANGLDSVQGQLTDEAAANYAAPMDDGSAAREQAINASYGQMQKRLDPMWAQKQEQANADLANQGLDPNSAAYRNAQADLSNSRNDAYSGAMNSAITNGNAAQSMTFQQNMQARNNPLEQLQRLASLTGTGPQYNTAGQAESNQALSAAQFTNQAQMAQWQAQQKAQADAISGGIGALGSVAGLAFGL